MGKNLFQKVWDIHKVGTLRNGATQLFIGLHYIHEVTSPQAFSMLEEEGLEVAYPSRTFATCDHIIPTDKTTRPFTDPLAENMLKAIEQNTKKNNITFFDHASGYQGIVHVIGPELGLTQPGMTIVCGDSHTATHGAFGSLAFGIGTSQVRDVLATQTLAMSSFKVRKVEIQGDLNDNVYAKDLILYIINKLGVKGGIGFAYEFCGTTIENLTMESRMTLCNMAIEGGARIGYVNPDEVTYDYIRGKLYAPKGDYFKKRMKYWESIKSDVDAEYEDEVLFNADETPPMVTWGINPGQSVPVSGRIPAIKNNEMADALEYMKFTENQKMEGTKIDVAFVGSCTNGRIEDLREVAEFLKGQKVSNKVKSLIVPGSALVEKQAEEEGLHEIFRDAGFEWRKPGCSMCLAMNPDKLIGDQLCVSTSNRNFKGRQGSTTGRTILMSPKMVAAAACAGEIVDIRKIS